MVTLRRPRTAELSIVIGTDALVGPSFLAKLRASGRVSASRFSAHGLTATHVAANIGLDGGKLQISELNAELFGGKHSGEWQADYSVKPAVFHGSGKVIDLSLEQLADAMKDEWISGTASGTYEITASGSSSEEFWQSGEGTLQFDLRDGTLPHISLEASGALKMMRFTGNARLHGGRFDVKEARLDSAAEKFQVSGTASLKRELDFKLDRTPNEAPPGYTIKGTLAAPRVSPSAGAETQARLRPRSVR